MSDQKIISPGELAIGMFVTVYEWIPWDAPSFEGGLLGGTTMVKHTDHSWCGDVLKVEAIQLPYVVVSLPNQGWLSSNVRLDTRRVNLMELTPEYVEAAKRKP